MLLVCAVGAGGSCVFGGGLVVVAVVGRGWLVAVGGSWVVGRGVVRRGW